jgi:RNA polymerase sigma factor (sigma-70 family)
MRDMSTGELVATACRGDQAAWNELVNRHNRLVYAVARSFRLSGADVADVFQTVWLRLAEHICRLRDPERVGAWLATTTRHECLRLVRSSWRVVPDDDVEAFLEPTETIENGLLRSEQRAAILAAFARLPDRDQRLLAMIVDPRYTYDDICRELGMRRGSIGPTRARCLRRLEDEYRALYPDELGSKEDQG